jgi:hypothetical protein
MMDFFTALEGGVCITLFGISVARVYASDTINWEVLPWSGLVLTQVIILFVVKGC